MTSTPQKTGRRIVATVALGAGVLIVAGVVATTGPNRTTGPAHSAPHRTAPHSAPATHQRAPSERADLASFKLDDRSQYGVADIWIKYTIVNHSSKASDYEIRWEALDPKTGVRVDSGTEGAYNVQPGQTAKEEGTTMLENTNVILKVTKFERTEAY